MAKQTCAREEKIEEAAEQVASGADYNSPWIFELGDPDHIKLPGGALVPTKAGKYTVVPPPDLSKSREPRFFLEYDYPDVLVRTRWQSEDSAHQMLCVVEMICRWTDKNPRLGMVLTDTYGYQFNGPTPCSEGGFAHQFIPDLSYIDDSTWSRLSTAEKDKDMKPCVPAVVVLFLEETGKLEDLQTKLSRFIDAGTRDGAIVDSIGEQVWIYKKGEEPRRDSFVPITFDSWPGFVLDCVALRETRELFS